MRPMAANFSRPKDTSAVAVLSAIVEDSVRRSGLSRVGEN